MTLLLSSLGSLIIPKTYLEQTKPLIDYYKEKNLLHVIDATSSVEEIFNRLDDEFVVSCFLDKEEVIGKIKEFNYDYEKVQNWVEEQI